jgi:radical SAM superfamily enzyme YgiQ (UPF0313 family)
VVPSVRSVRTQLRVLLVKPAARLATIRGLQAYALLEPIELAYVAGAVPEPHVVRVLDLRRSRFPGWSLRRALRSFAPDLVGFTAYSHESSEVRRLAVVARAVVPQARIVVGGHHATVAPGDFAIPAVDAVVRGEGCRPFRAIVEALSAGRDLLGIEQVLARDEIAAETGPPPPFVDPATLPFPLRDLWPSGAYRCAWTAEEAEDWSPLYPPVTMMRSSWGCRMKCTFCVVPFLCEGEHRPRPVEQVVDELAGIATDHVYFCDDENFIDEDFAGRLAEAIERRGIRKRYFAWVRATSVNRSPELLALWRRIGLDAAFLGFEFSSDEELRAVRKGGSVAANETALDRLRGMGVAVQAAFMVRPEYGEAEFERLHAYVRGLPPALCSFTVMTPSPGTPDYEAMKPRIWVDNPHDLHDAMHPLVPTRLPLREYARRFAALAAEGTARTPRRLKSQPAPPLDLLRAVRADRLYYRGFRYLYRDYPRGLWDRAASA